MVNNSSPLSKALVTGARFLICCYRVLLSPVLPARCRFHPTCSRYSLDAFKQFGFMRGVYLTVRRLSRCHPWGGSGFDPLPNPSTHSRETQHHGF